MNIQRKQLLSHNGNYPGQTESTQPWGCSSGHPTGATQNTELGLNWCHCPKVSADSSVPFVTGQAEDKNQASVSGWLWQALLGRFKGWVCLIQTMAHHQKVVEYQKWPSSHILHSLWQLLAHTEVVGAKSFSHWPLKVIPKPTLRYHLSLHKQRGTPQYL